MIKRSGTSLMVRSPDGEARSFSLRRLRDDIAASFRDVNCREEWMADIIAETVEDYLRLRAKSHSETPVQTSEISELVDRVLRETGMADVAACYGRGRRGSGVRRISGATTWNARRISDVLRQRMKLSTSSAERVAVKVADALRKLDVPVVADELIVHLGRHLGAEEMREPVDGRTAAGTSPVLVQPEELALRAEGDVQDWVRCGIVIPLPVRTLVPAIRVVLHMDRFCASVGLPLTELAFLPRLRVLGRSVRGMVEAFRTDVADRVPHAEVYPARITIVRLEPAICRGLDANGFAGTRLAEEARRLLERHWSEQSGYPVVLRYTDDLPAEALHCDVAAEDSLIPG